MMLYATILGCLSPVLTIAACLSYKSPFSGSREQVWRSKFVVGNQNYGCLSDGSRMYFLWPYMQSGAVARAKHALISGTKESNGLGSSICRGQQSDQLVMAAVYCNWRTVVKNVLHIIKFINIS